MDHPLLRLQPKQDRRLKAGFPWAFSNEIAMTPDHRAWPPGQPVRLEGDDGWRYGTFAFNPAQPDCGAVPGPGPSCRH